MSTAATTVDRARLERFAALVAEAKIREERRRQSARGGLLHFVRYFWDILEPQTPLVEGWTLDAICEHLEAVSYGEITRLLVNVPPGFMKSLLTNVFWPAWEWSALGRPHLRYVTFSYAATLTERDNSRFRDLVTSRRFRTLWGSQFLVRNTGVTRVTNDKTGWKLASSVGGVGTGERGNRVLCVSGETVVETENGKRTVSQLVACKNARFVLGFDHSTNRPRWQRIRDYESNPSRPLVRVSFDGDSLVCTADHPVFVVGRGYAEAQSLREGEEALFLAPVPGLREAVPPALQDLQQAMQEPNGERSGASAEYASVLRVSEGNLSDSGALGAPERLRSVLQPQVPRERFDGFREPWMDWRSRYAGVRAMWKGVRIQAWAGRGAELLFSPVRYIAALARWIAQGKAAAAEVLRGMRAPGRQAQSFHSVLLQGLCGAFARQAHAGRGEWPLRSRRSSATLWPRMDSEAQERGAGAGRILLPRLRHDHEGARDGAPRSPYQLRQERYGIGQSDLSVSDLPRIDARWHGVSQGVVRKTVRSVERAPDCASVYNVRVEPDHNYFANGVLTHNCDDPHNVKEAESETVRTETVRWFEEAMSNRLNDLGSDAIIVIMQRVHEADVSGAIIEGYPEYVHLCIPMEYEADRHCETEIGWSDPRTIDGELAWPERFGPDVLEPFKRRPYVWAGQYQQRPEPRGGGIFKRDWWQEWDPKDGKFPSFEYMVASLDTAYTTKQENDPSALTIWGVFRDMNNNPKVMLCAAWRERLELNPLVEKVASSCRRFKVDRLLIESKAAGISVAQEIRRLHAGELWGIQLVDPKGADKVARAYAVQHLFEDGLVHAPNREWADMVIDEMASFPRAAHDDLCDTATQALKHLRSIGLAVRKDERQAEMQRAMQYKRPSGPLYPMV